MRRYLCEIILMCACALTMQFAQAQEVGTIKGQVLCASTEQPIYNVGIFINDIRNGTVSDSSGSFVIKDVPVGTWRLTASHISYKRQSIKVNVYPHVEADIIIQLDKDTTYTLPAIQISDYAISNEISRRKPYVLTVINPTDINNSYRSDIGDILRTAPNVSGVRKGGGAIDPVVRGFRFSQLNIRKDYGQRIEGGCPNRMDPTLSHIEKEEIANIEIVKGPYALHYGPVSGGIINIITRKPVSFDEPTIKVAGSRMFDFLRKGYAQNLDLYGGNKKIHFLLSGTDKKFGDYYDGNGNRVLSSGERYAYKGMLTYKPLANHSLTASYTENKARNIRFPALPMDERSDDTRLVSFDYEATDIANSDIDVQIKLFRSEVNHLMDNKNRSISDTVVASTYVEAITSGYRLYLSMPFAGGMLTGGTDHERVTKDGSRLRRMIMQPFLPQREDVIWNDALITNYGVFAGYNRSYNQWIFDIALRSDVNHAESKDIERTNSVIAPDFIYPSDSTYSDYFPISASLGITRQVSENFSLSLSAGRGVRSPDMTERFIALLPVGYDNFDYLGNPSLKPETNNQVDITSRLQTEYGYISFNLFYAYIENFITGKRLPPAVMMPNSANVAGVKMFVNADYANMTGFEFEYLSPKAWRLGIQANVAHTEGTVSQAYVYYRNTQGEIVSERTVKDDYMPEMPPWEANLILKYPMMKRKFTPYVHFRYVGMQDNLSLAYEEKKTPSFFLTDINFIWSYSANVQFSAGVANVFNKAYYEHLNRRIIGSSNKLYEPGRAIFLKISVNV